MEKFFSESCSVENIFNFMPQGSGRNSQRIKPCRLTYEFRTPTKDDLMSLNGLEVGRGFPLHQLRDGAGIGGTMMCGQGGDKAPVVIVPKIVGVVVGFGQVDADFLQILVQAGKVQRLGIGNDAVEIEDERPECRHRMGEIVLEVFGANYNTGQRKKRQIALVLVRNLEEEKVG